VPNGGKPFSSVAARFARESWVKAILILLMARKGQDMLTRFGRR
jgi:hypothetical protein